MIETKKAWKALKDGSDFERYLLWEATRAFTEESNRIEGILDPSYSCVQKHVDFLLLEEVTLEEVEAFVSVCQPGAKLREVGGLNVRVGNHIPPPGGPAVGYALEDLLKRANAGEDRYQIHCEYEVLHPFTDGNGRSGRAIWMWQFFQEEGTIPREFLRHFYYETLDRSRR